MIRPGLSPFADIFRVSVPACPLPFTAFCPLKVTALGSPAPPMDVGIVFLESDFRKRAPFLTFIFRNGRFAPVRFPVPRRSLSAQAHRKVVGVGTGVTVGV